MYKTLLVTALLVLLSSGWTSAAETNAQRVQAELPQITAWRRDLHQHPELSNREVRTSKLVADELTRLGYQVRTVTLVQGPDALAGCSVVVIAGPQKGFEPADVIQQAGEGLSGRVDALHGPDDPVKLKAWTETLEGIWGAWTRS